MSVEVVRLGDHRIYLIVGDPTDGYDVLATDPTPIAHYPRKYEARHALRHGAIAWNRHQHHGELEVADG